MGFEPELHDRQPPATSTVQPDTEVWDIEWALREFDHFDGKYKRDAVDIAIRSKEEITPRLLAILRDLIANPRKFLPCCTEHGKEEGIDHSSHEEEGHNTWSHIYAVTLLSHFREPHAHQLIADAFSLPGDLSSDLFGDMVTEDLSVLLYSTYPGSPEAIQSLVLNRRAYAFCRNSAADALALCVATGLLDRDETLKFLTKLFTGHEASEDSDFWSFLACTVLDLYPESHMEIIRDAYSQGLVSPGVVGLESFEQTIQESSVEDCMAKLRKELDRRLPTDVNKKLEHWACFSSQESKIRSGIENEQVISISTGTLVRSQPKVGRNDPCPCGSGKKFKKCCLQPGMDH